MARAHHPLTGTGCGEGGAQTGCHRTDIGGRPPLKSFVGERAECLDQAHVAANGNGSYSAAQGSRSGGVPPSRRMTLLV